ncbi:MAG: carboxypeptidase-like regulatory domain-containing protein [Planctomycetota bacterium]
MSHRTDPELAPEWDEQAIDALLCEYLTREAPPRMTDAVLERHHRGDGALAASVVDAAAHAATRRSNGTWLAAALLLLGVGAVLGTIWMADADDAGRRMAANGPKDPMPELWQDPEPRERQDPKGKKEAGRAEQEQQGGAGQERRPAKLPFEMPPSEAGGDERFFLRVVDHQGGPVQSFRFRVLGSSLGDRPLFVGIPALRDLRREPRDFSKDEGRTAVEGLRPGVYRVLVDDGVHAPSMSAAFAVAQGSAVEVLAQLKIGGTISGVVRDSRGAPVAGAVVSTGLTLPEGMVDASAFGAHVLDRLPGVITPRQVTTAADGSYSLQRLRPSSYHLSVVHPDFCVERHRDIQVEGGKEAAAARFDVRLRDGALVRGKVSLDGAPVPGARIAVFTDERDARQKLSMRADAQGRFVARFRLPPGDYKICGNVEPVGRQASKLEQRRRSSIAFAVRPRQAEAEVDVVLR